MSKLVHRNLTEILKAEYHSQLAKCAMATSIKEWKAVSTDLLELSRNLIQTARFDGSTTIRLHDTNLQYFSNIEDFKAHCISTISDRNAPQDDSGVFELALQQLSSDGLAVIGKFNASVEDYEFVVVIDTASTELENLLDIYFQFILGREPDELGARSLLSACIKENDGSPFWLLGAVGRSIEAKTEGIEWLLNDTPSQICKPLAHAGGL